MKGQQGHQRDQGQQGSQSQTPCPYCQCCPCRPSCPCNKGLFITFEGGEGAGKTTLIERVRAELEQQGQTVLATREPGGTALGEQIREWLLSPKVTVPIVARAELCLFLAARAQHIEECIAPALMQGHVVLCDRFNDSTMAYQGAGRDLGLETVAELCRLICGSIQPTCTFYLDIDPTIGLERVRGRSQETNPLDKMESETMIFHKKIRNAFLQIAEHDPQRMQVVDAHQSPEAVFQQVFARIHERLG